MILFQESGYRQKQQIQAQNTSTAPFTEEVMTTVNELKRLLCNRSQDMVRLSDTTSSIDGIATVEC